MPTQKNKQSKFETSEGVGSDRVCPGPQAATSVEESADMENAHADHVDSNDGGNSGKTFTMQAMAVSQNQGTPIYTPKYYSPYYGDP